MSAVAARHPPASQPEVVGRETELRSLRGFFGEDRAVCLVLTGEQGIGKTALWEEGLEMAAALGYAVFPARASEAESSLTYAALADLVEAIGDDAFLPLPPPQRRALEIALRRVEPSTDPPDPMAISAGLLGALRCRGQEGRMLIAVDDVQWLDAASSGPIQFAARRMTDGGLRFLVIGACCLRACSLRLVEPQCLAVGRTGIWPPDAIH